MALSYLFPIVFLFSLFFLNGPTRPLQLNWNNQLHLSFRSILWATRDHLPLSSISFFLLPTSSRKHSASLRSTVCWRRNWAHTVPTTSDAAEASYPSFLSRHFWGRSHSSSRTNDQISPSGHYLRSPWVFLEPLLQELSFDTYIAR